MLSGLLNSLGLSPTEGDALCSDPGVRDFTAQNCFDGIILVSFQTEGPYSVLFSCLLLFRQTTADRVHLFPLESEAAFSFSQMLAAVLLLLQLWGSGRQETDNERAAQGTSAPLLPLLQRFQSLTGGKDAAHAEADAHVSAAAPAFARLSSQCGGKRPV